MAEDRISLAPTGIYGRSDEEEGPNFHRKADKRPSKLPVYVLAAIVILFGIFLILAQIFLRITAPEIKLRTVTVRNLRSGNSSNPFFNATLVNEIRIKNPNFGYFEFENSIGSVVYGNRGVVGEMKIGGGKVRARETARLIGIQTEIGSYRLPDSRNLSSDLRLGFLHLRSVAEIRGRVHVMGRRRRKISEMSCTMRLILTDRSIQDLSCK